MNVSRGGSTSAAPGAYAYLRRKLRTWAIACLRRVNPGVISIRHHYTGERFRLHSFLHKGYWYHGKRREGRSMALFAQFVRPGDTVVEVGGHIGYMTLYFAHLVGANGTVIVFEPGANNLPYIRANIGGKSHVQLVEKAASDFSGPASFFLEHYTGQNNSLLSDYGGFDETLRSAGMQARESRSVVQVDCTTLDAFLAEAPSLAPSFIKIDVEGAEVSVLRGMERTLRRPATTLMVEVTENARAIFELLSSAGYLGFTSGRQRIVGPDRLHGNTFWLRPTDARLGIFGAPGS